MQAHGLGAGQRLVQVAGAEVVDIVDPRQRQFSARMVDADRFVQQHAHAQCLEGRYHADRVVVAQHGVHGVAQMRPQPRQRVDGRLPGLAGAPTVVAGEHAQVVAKAL